MASAAPSSSDRRVRREVGLSLCLAGLAGWVDAVAYLHWHGLYASFMSGNSTQLASSASGHDPSRSLQLGSLLLTFVAGVVCGELVARLGARYGRPLVLVLEAVLLTAAATLVQWAPSATAGLLLLAGALGTQNASVHRTGGVSLAVTYVTGTLVHLAQGIGAALLGRGRWREAVPYLGLWLALMVGAAAGAGIEQRSAALAVAAAALFAATLAAATVGLPPSRGGARP